MSGTFLVRNAQLDSTAYTTERTNLTLLAVSTNNTINGTAVRTLRLGDGSPADPAIALDVLPTGLVELDTDSLVSQRPDVLQVLTEDEVAAVTPPAGVTGIFPYAFVERNAMNNNSVRVGGRRVASASLPVCSLPLSSNYSCLGEDRGRSN